MERSRRGFPLAEPAWLVVLRGFCAVAEGADVLVPSAGFAATSAECIAAVLGDALRRLGVMGGRDGLPRSLGSVLGYAVARFVGGHRGGNVRNVLAIVPSRRAGACGGIAVSRDGATLLVSYLSYPGEDGICAYSVETGARLGAIGASVCGPLRFNHPRQIWIAPDDFVFVADCYNHRVHVLTPQLDFHSFVGAGHLSSPSGVCGDNTIVAVSDSSFHRINVFRRGDGALLRRFGSYGSGDGQLNRPQGLCFMGSNSHIAVADWGNDRVAVFSLEGEFIRHVGVGTLRQPVGVACSAFDELVVAEYYGDLIVVFRASGEVLHTIGDGVNCFLDVAIRGDVIFAKTCRDDHCVVFT
jgi:hypothetical protein